MDILTVGLQLHECVGSALGALGPETFLGILPLNLEANDLSDVNVWLFPILKQHIVGANLSFFSETLLGLIGEMGQRSRKVIPALDVFIFLLSLTFSNYFLILAA